MEEGVKINLISRETIMAMSPEEKINFILDQVRQGVLLVLETGLTPIEEAELYTRVMDNIDQNTFIGIEIQGIAPAELRKKNFLERLLSRGKREPPRMAVIGPAQMLKTIYKDGRQIQAVILTKGTAIVDEDISRPVQSDIKGSGYVRVLKEDGNQKDSNSDAEEGNGEDGEEQEQNPEDMWNV